MRQRHSWLKWIAVAAAAAWVARRYWPATEADRVARNGFDFDDEQFLHAARTLARRERDWAHGVVLRSQDDALRTLARMALAQHEASDGVWIEFASDTTTHADDHLDAHEVAPDGFDLEAAYTLQEILDDAWPLFDEASQRSDRDDIREWSLDAMAWLEESEQTLAPILERLQPASAPADAFI